MKSVIAVPFARKLSGRTNYRKRLALLKSDLPRLIVRKTLRGIVLQIAMFEAKGDRVLITVSAKNLRSLGWEHSCKNIPAAYLGGMLLGKKALQAKIEKATPDIGMQSVTKGGKIFAALKGARDAGLQIAVSEEVAPSMEAISGKKIAEFAKSAAGSQFSKSKNNAAKIAEDFEKIKSAMNIGGNK